MKLHNEKNIPLNRGFIRSVLGLLCGFWAMAASAKEMVTDRPDATESSSVVKPGYVQAELGWIFTDRGGGTNTEFPQTLIRVGVVHRVELRLGWSGYTASDAADGAGDGELGVKVYLAEEQGLFPETALLAALSIPWGDGEISSHAVDPSFRFAFSHTLSERFSLGYNLGAEWTTENDSTLSSFVYTTALGIGLTDSWGAFIELFGDVGLSAPTTAHSFDGGITYLLRENLQLDVMVGVGLSEDAEDWFAGTGVSYRFPN